MEEASIGASAVLGSFAIATLAWSLFLRLTASRRMTTAEARLKTAYLWSYLGERKAGSGDAALLEPHESIGYVRGLPRGGLAWPAAVIAFALRYIILIANGLVVPGLSEFWLGAYVALNFVAIIPLAFWLHRWRGLLWVSYDKPYKAAAAGLLIFLVVGDTTLSVLYWLERMG